MQQVAKLINEGYRLWEAGRKDDALATLRAAASVDPDLPDAWMDIAELLREMGDEQQALEADRQVVEIGDGIPDLIAEVAQARARLERAEKEKEKKHALKKEAKATYDEIKSECDRLERQIQEAEEAFEQAEAAFNELLQEMYELASSNPSRFCVFCASEHPLSDCHLMNWGRLSDPTWVAYISTMTSNPDGSADYFRGGRRRAFDKLWPQLTQSASNVMQAFIPKRDAHWQLDAKSRTLKEAAEKLASLERKNARS